MQKILYLTVLLFTSFPLFSDTSRLEFHDGWIKQLPPVIPMRAGYVKINNPASTAKKIVGIQSPAFEKVEMHESLMADGMMKMEQLPDIEIPAKAMVEFKPGGKHMMLISPLKTLKLGDQVEISITFGDGSSQSTLLEVRK